MRVNNIQNTNNNIQYKGYMIKTKDNKNVEFLYNKIHDVFEKEQQTIIYATDYVKFDKLTDKIKQKLEKFNIIFAKIMDKDKK